MMSRSYYRFAGYSAIGAGILTLIYSLGFVVLKNQLLFSLAQLLGAILTVAAVIGLYGRLRKADEGFALIAVALALAGAVVRPSTADTIWRTP